MWRWERQVTVNAPAERVFAYIADLTRHPEWAGNPLEVRSTSDGPLGVGASFESKGRQLGSHTDAITITEYDPPRTLAFEVRGDAGHTRNWFTLSASGAATSLTKGFANLKPVLPLRFMYPGLALLVPKGLRKDLTAIKSRIESGA